MPIRDGDQTIAPLLTREKVQLEFPNLEIDFSMATLGESAERVYKYWLSKIQSELPTWLDIQLMDLYDLAPNFMIKEVVDDGGEWRNRYFGSGLANILGVEGTNKRLAEYHSPENTSKALTFFNTISSERRPVRVSGQCIVQNREFRNLEGVYLPLKDADGLVSMIMCYEFYGDLPATVS